jgi:hypothetical protein
MHDRHMVERGNAAELSRPEPAYVEERRKEQVRDMNKRHAEMRRAMGDKHDRELERLK